MATHVAKSTNYGVVSFVFASLSQPVGKRWRGNLAKTKGYRQREIATPFGLAKTGPDFGGRCI
jgi:hypothetical protein